MRRIKLMPMTDRNRPGLTLRLLLLTLLLAAQGVAAAHAIDHFPADDGSLCTVCTVGSGLDSSAVTTMEMPVAAPVKAAPATGLDSCLPIQRAATYSARGPPSLL